MLYALLVGFAVGLIVGGRPGGIARLEFRWSWVLIGGLFVQLVLFSDQVAAVVGSLGPPIYVASTAAVFVAVLRNVRMVGMPLVALGSACNLAAILANGGFMPAGRDAMAALGLSDREIYSNSAVVANPALEPLTDVFAMPPWMPMANIFSVGDVLLGLGVMVVIVAAMRRVPPGAPDAADPTQTPETTLLPT
jgi:hypothetical protein